MKPDISALPGGFEPKDITFTIQGGLAKIEPIIPGAFLLHNVITDIDNTNIRSVAEQSHNFESVSIQGRKDIVDDRVGSLRTTMWAPEIADMIWDKISHLFHVRSVSDTTLTDWWQHGKHTEWRPTGLSPMLRYMRYGAMGQHYAHYDAGYIHPDNTDKRTLQSIVLYLTTNGSGATRFIKDNQAGPVWGRNHDDFITECTDADVIAKVLPQQNNMLVFDHRMCHDVELYDGVEGDRIIIRGDVYYEAIR